MPHRLQGLPLHILVAEDSPDEAYLFELLFAQCQVLSTYEIVSSGQEAIDYLSGKPPFNDRGEHPSPTLFLLDIKMPGLDGFDVLHWMQQHPEKAVIPTYILTCSGASTDVRQAFALGAYGYFIKQSGIQQYTELLTTVSRFWQMGQWPVPLERAGSIGEAARAGGPTVHN